MLLHDHLLQKVQPDIMCGGALAKPGIVVLATEKLDVVITLVEMEIEVAAALWAFQQAGENAGLLRDRRPLTTGAAFQTLHLFPCGTVNNGLMHIEKDRPVFFGSFDAAVYLVGLGITLKVDDVATALFASRGFSEQWYVPISWAPANFWNRRALCPCSANSGWE